MTRKDGPDRQVPFEETLKAVDKAFHQGKFKRFGLSNFKAWEVTEIVFLCEKNGWLKPTTYQVRSLFFSFLREGTERG